MVHSCPFLIEQRNFWSYFCFVYHLLYLEGQRFVLISRFLKCLVTCWRSTQLVLLESIFKKIGKPVFTFAIEDSLECCLKFFSGFVLGSATYLTHLFMFVYSFDFH